MDVMFQLRRGVRDCELGIRRIAGLPGNEDTGNSGPWKGGMTENRD